MFSATIGTMLSPSAKCANRFQTPVKRGAALCLSGLFAFCFPLTAIFAATDTPVTDGVHKVGLADSRVGYETVSYVTDSKVVIQTLGKRQPLFELSLNPPLGCLK